MMILMMIEETHLVLAIDNEEDKIKNLNYMMLWFIMFFKFSPSNFTELRG